MLKKTTKWFNVPEAASTPDFQLPEPTNSREQDEEFQILSKLQYGNETEGGGVVSTPIWMDYWYVRPAIRCG